jgi:DNA (cytosine-5)-methyltransferase 1
LSDQACAPRGALAFGSVCSGIEAASVAWHPLGWRAAFVSEVEPFANAVLAHHFPDVPNRGDMRRFEEWPDATIDVLVGGTPCQSFSIAGFREGIRDPRGSLMLAFAAIARRYRPRWLVWENVPGVIPSNGGRDFASFLGLLSGRHVEAPAGGFENGGIIPGIESAYGVAWRVLDAQYFGLAQRRKRVFVVGHFGNWRRACAVLLERSSLSGNPAPRRQAGERVAPTIEARANAGGAGWGTDFIAGGGITCTEDGIAGSVSAKWLKGTGGPAGDEHYNLIVPPALGMTGACVGMEEELAPTISGDHANRVNDVGPIVFTQNQREEVRELAVAGALPAMRRRTDAKGETLVAFAELADPLAANQANTYTREGKNFRVSNVARTDHGVRRLTPRECERLQGFPDDFTLIPYNGKPAKDGPRYRAIGNSMAVPVMRWIGERIEMVDAIADEPTLYADELFDERGIRASSRGIPASSAGRCAKAHVTCTIISAIDKRTVIGTNEVANAQAACPREPGDDYTKCKTICRQHGHAEEIALEKARVAGLELQHAVAVISGIDWICKSCGSQLREAGIARVQLTMGV